MSKTVIYLSVLLMLFNGIVVGNIHAAEDTNQAAVNTNISTGPGTAAGAGVEEASPGFFFKTAGQIVAALVAIAGVIAVASDSDGSTSTTSH